MENNGLENIKKTFDCCDPWYSLIKNQQKVVEGRICNEKYSGLENGDIIKLLKTENEEEFVLLKIINIEKYKTFREMIESETLERVLPNITTIDEGVEVYRKFYTEKIENKKGVIAITIELIS